MRPRVVLFDVMDTLVHDPFRASVPAVFGLSLDDYHALKDHDAYLAFERGELDVQAWAARVFVDRRAVDLAALERFYRAHYRWIDGMPALVDDLLARGVALHALSNYGPLYPWIDEELSLGDRVPWTFVSCRTGRRKPAREAYLGAASALGVPPASCVFVDDREKNCAGARDAGMTALRFEGAAPLRAALEALGLL